MITDFLFLLTGFVQGFGWRAAARMDMGAGLG
jgi:hypothetical protein